MSARREVALALGAYGLYLLVRRAVMNPTGQNRARRNAEAVMAAERRLGCDIAPRVHEVALRAPRAVGVLNAGYALGNTALSVGWLILLFRRRDPVYPRERRALLAAFMGALPVFLALPTAPPRHQEGFVDTLEASGVDLDHPQLVHFYNPIAAMPSHHMAFAVVTGLGLASRAGRPLGRAAWLGYAPAVGTIVVATGNHYLLDVAAGAALGLVARWVTR